MSWSFGNESAASDTIFAQEPLPSPFLFGTPLRMFIVAIVSFVIGFAIPNWAAWKNGWVDRCGQTRVILRAEQVEVPAGWLGRWPPLIVTRWCVYVRSAEGEWSKIVAEENREDALHLPLRPGERP